MARGASSKSTITEKLLQVFEGAFVYNNGKEIRIPMMEDGEELQIKVTLTCAKDNVNPNNDAETIVQKTLSTSSAPVVQPSAEELETVKRLMEKLNL